MLPPDFRGGLVSTGGIGAGFRRRLMSRFSCRSSRLVGSTVCCSCSQKSCQMTIEPGDQILSIEVRIRVEFEGVVSFGIVDYQSVGGSQPFEKRQREIVIDDAIPAGLHQECRLFYS